jgi:hypothetical protein
MAEVTTLSFNYSIPNNLLSLLEKHGHKARINIAEAKKIMKG